MNLPADRRADGWSDLPPVSVVVSTRNRGERIAETIETILLNDHPDFEVRVIDQSDGDATAAALRRFLSDPRLFYVRTTSRGLSAGRNLGIEGARNELIAVTDDDCRVPADWLRELASAFGVDRRIGVVFGSVHPGPHDPSRGFIMSYRRKETFLARSLVDQRRLDCLAACMGMRKSVWRTLGGFDELLGAGAPFPSAEEMDFAIRALSTGSYIYESPSFSVVHLGFRTWRQGRVLIPGYLFGIGAVFGKHMKRRPWPIVRLLLHLGERWAFRQPGVDFGRVPPRWPRLRAFVKGFISGAIRPMDWATGHFALSARERHPSGSGLSEDDSGLKEGDADGRERRAATGAVS